MNILQQIQEQVLAIDVFAELLRCIDEVSTLKELNDIVLVFQKFWKVGHFTPDQTAIIVAKGKKKRAELSTAEERRRNVQYARANTQRQSYGLPQLPDDERELYQRIQAVDLRSHDPLGQLERLELVYAERERSEAGKKMLMALFEQRGRELSAVWAEVKGAR